MAADQGQPQLPSLSVPWRVPERPSHCQHSAEVIGPGQAQRAARPAATPVVPEWVCAASSIAKAAGVEALSTRNPIWPLLRGDIFHHFAWKSSTIPRRVNQPNLRAAGSANNVIAAEFHTGCAKP